jgi:hypothetical protein
MFIQFNRCFRTGSPGAFSCRSFSAPCCYDCCLFFPSSNASAMHARLVTADFDYTGTLNNSSRSVSLAVHTPRPTNVRACVATATCLGVASDGRLT